MTATQPYQLLVSPVDVLPPGRQQRRIVGHARADSVVSPKTFLLDSNETLLIPVVDRRHSTEREKDRHRADCPIRPDHTGYPSDIVVSDERVWREVRQKLIVTFQRPVEFKEVPIPDAGPDCLPQLVLRHRIDTRFSDELGVVAVDDLSQEPGIGVISAHYRQDPRPEVGTDGIGGIEPLSGDPAFQPVFHDSDGIIRCLFTSVVQPHK